MPGTALYVRAFIAGVTASVRNEVLKCILLCHKLLGSTLFSYSAVDLKCQLCLFSKTSQVKSLEICMGCFVAD